MVFTPADIEYLTVNYPKADPNIENHKQVKAYRAAIPCILKSSVKVNQATIQSDASSTGFIKLQTRGKFLNDDKWIRILNRSMAFRAKYTEILENEIGRLRNKGYDNETLEPLLTAKTLLRTKIFDKESVKKFKECIATDMEKRFEETQVSRMKPWAGYKYKWDKYNLKVRSITLEFFVFILLI